MSLHDLFRLYPIYGTALVLRQASIISVIAGTYIATWGAGYHGQLGRKFIRGQKKYSAIPMHIDMVEPRRCFLVQDCC